MLAFHDGVNATAGLDLVRTSPDHGTAWDLAGQGRADAGSMLAALHTAIAVVKNRRATR
jgi:4-hydroxythreonine-4-phosphate dehydrogenase